MKIDKTPALEKDKATVKNMLDLSYKDVIIAQYGRWDSQSEDEGFEEDWLESEHIFLYKDTVPVGLYSYDVHEQHISINQLVVLPEFQGQGIGTQILSELIELANELKKDICLETYRINRAQFLYKKLGFVIEGHDESHIQMRYTS